MRGEWGERERSMNERQRGREREVEERGTSRVKEVGRAREKYSITVVYIFMNLFSMKTSPWN